MVLRPISPFTTDYTAPTNFPWQYRSTGLPSAGSGNSLLTARRRSTPDNRKLLNTPRSSLLDC